MIYNVVLHSGVHQSESVIHIHISTLSGSQSFERDENEGNNSTQFIGLW